MNWHGCPQVKLPLLGVELDSGDVNIFPTVADAQSYIESYDLDTWQLFGADGLVFALSSNGEGQPVIIKPTSDHDTIKLREFIQRYLDVLGYKADTERAKLNTILDNLKRF